MEEEDRLGALMRKARGGDEPAYALLLEEAARRLRGFLTRRAGGDAEDIVQECLIAMHKRRETWDERRPFAPWMLAIARYKMIDHFRRTGRRQEVTDEIRDLPPEAQEDMTAAQDIETLLDRLPEGQSEAIRLTRIEGLTSAEAGSRMGIGVSAVKVRVHRGLARLRAIVGVDGQ